MTRRSLVRGNSFLFALSLALTAGAFALPNDYQLVVLALGLGLMMFSGFWAVMLFATAKRPPRS
jgi:hypothetical protein